MFFAQRTRRRVRIALAACALYAAVIAAVAVLFPREDRDFVSSFGWWFVAIPLGLLAYAVLESLGTWSLERPFWQGMPSWARVLLLVAIISLVSVSAVLVSRYTSGA